MYINLAPNEFRRDLRPIINDHLQFYEHIKWFLVDKAREVAKRAELSYRHFAVGCALYAWNPLAYYYEDVHKIFLGANSKTREDIDGKACAERIAVSAAYAKGYKLVIGMAVTGQAQADRTTGIESKTLVPCEDCRILFIDSPIVMPDTRIMTAHPTEDDIFEEFTVESLNQKYKTY